MTLNEIRTKINELVEKHVENANRVITSRGRKVSILVSSPKVVFFNKGRRAGWCKYFTNELGFNEILARDNWEEFENTVIHEVAHLATKCTFPSAKQHHGPEFRWVMTEMGGSGNTYHSYDVSNVKVVRKPQKKYVYTCNCDTHNVSGKVHSGIRYGKKYTCRKCKTVIKFTGKSVG